MCLCTIYLGLEVGILVQYGNLLFPVKLIPPIGHHPLEMGGVESVLEAGILQGFCVACLVNAIIKILSRQS